MAESMPDSRELDELEVGDAAAAEGWPNPEVVIANRAGRVLIRDTILKSDHFPGCQNLKLTPLLDGAPNFRKVDGLPIYGVAIPTVKGLRTVLDVLGCGRGGRKVLWHNMREEPVIYINGQPYVVRDCRNPLTNLEYTGIKRETVEQMEERLKEDILTEATQMQNTILVAGEDDNFNVVNQWESVTEVDVQTPLEVYAELQANGYDVDYFRVPLTDEKAPKDKDFDELVSRCWNMPPGSAVVFNCQMGRGRTTTGTIIASLLLVERLIRTDSEEHLPKWYNEAVTTAAAWHPTTAEEELKAGMFDAVRSLVRVLEGGTAAKARLDALIDHCSQMQNLREAIGVYRGRMLREQAEHKRDHLLNALLEYLERYYVLIAFTCYVGSVNFAPRKESHKTYQQWASERGELTSILDRMLRRNPFAALSVKRLKGADTNELQSMTKAEKVSMQSEDVEDEEGSKVMRHIASRQGAVLGSYTILKVDHWPGMQSHKITTTTEGAPNFRGLMAAGVYASALPTADGMRRVLELVGAGPSEPMESPPALWHNMREEPVVYINGRPFVLRENARPYKNMQEYNGIDWERLESMEARLKADVVAEAQVNGGQVLLSYEKVANEVKYDMKSSVLVHEFEVVEKDAVKTTADMFRDLRAEGYKVDYWRVPVTDGHAPEESDLDNFRKHLEKAHAESPLVFSCQMGLGRSTIGMITGCLLRMESRGLDVKEMLGTVDGLSPDAEQFDTDLSWTRPAEEEVMGELIEHGQEERTKEVDAMLNGEYMAIRRLVRGLVRGEKAKKTADKIITACAVPVNIRVEIMTNLKLNNAWEYHRYDELQERRTSFRRGAAYLDRYWTIIAYAAYTLQRMWAKGVMAEAALPEGTSPRLVATQGDISLSTTFEEWIDRQPELKDIRKGIHSNPSGALALCVQQELPTPETLQTLSGMTDHVPVELQQEVLGLRSGSILHRNTILKSYHVPVSRTYTRVEDLPIYTIGSPNFKKLQDLLKELGCEPGSNKLAIITDITEETTIFIKGKPYVRRELEMPVRALHHAGISYRKLQEMEINLANDLAGEVSHFRGSLLVHHEVGERISVMAPPNKRQKHHITRRSLTSSSYGDFDALQGAGDPWDPSPLRTGKKRSTPSQSSVRGHEQEITKMFDKNPGNAVVGTWEKDISLTEGAVQDGIATTKQVFQHLRKMGYRVEYKRIPLSRDRTPIPSDIDHLQLQLKYAEREQQGAEQQGGSPQEAVHLIMSRSMTGSSCRYVASLLATNLAASPMDIRGAAMDNVPSPLGGCPKLTRSIDLLNLPERGEHRCIMNLLRVLEYGPDLKEAVDEAIDKCTSIGDIREDMVQCWLSANNPDSMLEESNETKQLGLHYLQRYALLIMFRVYMQVNNDKAVTFSQWFHSRSELGNLLKAMKLY